MLQKFGYLTPSTQLTADGEWARLIRIDHSLLITELIRAEAFTGADPSLLAGILASLAHDDDRQAFPGISPGLSSCSARSALAESLSPYEDPPSYAPMWRPWLSAGLPNPLSHGSGSVD